uniref:Uncharacterized protein n=3 Tax=Paenibacillus popilliae TaxID=78057 RepID=A0A0D6CAF2_PAEPP|nr:hypothetical protein [Paenibacillus popilliae ATCC 14706]
MSERADVLQEGIWRLIEAAAALSMYKFCLPDRLRAEHDEAELLMIELIDRFYKLRGAVLEA